MTDDQIKRLKVPKRSDIPTSYHPRGNLVMIIPIPDITQVGQIVLPHRSAIQLNEGHIVELGPRCGENAPIGDALQVGDCVTWELNSESRMDVDGEKFILVNESNILMSIPIRELVEDQSKYNSSFYAAQPAS